MPGAARPPLREPAVLSIRQAYRSSRLEIIAATHEDWQRGFEFYEARPDKSWSLVDCISILICQNKGIAEVFTADHHFTQAGFTILVSGST